MKSYCSDQDLSDIKKANDYKELFIVAFRVLKSMTRMHPNEPIAMVCGPVSANTKSSRADNLKRFSVAIDRITTGGMVVFSQMPFEDTMERIYNSDPTLQGLKLLEEFYEPIFRMRFIKLMCFLPGWEKSVGATWEHEQAKKLWIPVLYLADSYIAD